MKIPINLRQPLANLKAAFLVQMAAAELRRSTEKRAEELLRKKNLADEETRALESALRLNPTLELVEKFREKKKEREEASRAFIECFSETWKDGLDMRPILKELALELEHSIEVPPELERLRSALLAREAADRMLEEAGLENTRLCEEVERVLSDPLCPHDVTLEVLLQKQRTGANVDAALTARKLTYQERTAAIAALIPLL